MLRCFPLGPGFRVMCRSRMIAWDFIEQIGLLCVPLFECLEGRFVM